MPQQRLYASLHLYHRGQPRFTGFVKGEDGFSIFIKAIPYNYYALFTIIAMVTLVVLQVDFGPMAKHEANAQKGDLFTTGDRPYAEAKQDVIKGKGRL